MLIIGANYYGTMATAQRIRNLINPLLKEGKITASNLLFNTNEIPTTEEQTVHFKNIFYSKKNPISFIGSQFKALRYIKQQKKKNSKNILFCYGYPIITNIILLKYAKYIGYKVVFNIEEKFTSHKPIKKDIFTLIKWKSINFFLNQIPQIGSLCFAISTRLIEYCNSICKNEIPVVKLPVSVDIDYVQSFRKDMKKDKIQIFYGGSFGLKDGIPFLIEGFAKACKEIDKIELVLTGKIAKGFENSVLNLIEESGVKDRIKYLGCLSTEEYYQTMVNADILCMLRVDSDYANAGFPFKLVEYLASGNAIIATRVSDVEKYIDSSEDIILIDPQNPNAICMAIQALSVKKHIDFRDNILAIAKKYFDANIVANMLCSNLSSMFK